jgi:hypothetical protein
MVMRWKEEKTADGTSETKGEDYGGGGENHTGEKKDIVRMVKAYFEWPLISPQQLLQQ